MREPRRYNPPMVRPGRCPRCGSDIVAFLEEEYDPRTGEPPFLARMWHCKRCDWSAIEEVKK